MKKTILIILVLAAAVGGCKKYEEGPLISLRSAESRIYGNRVVTRYTVDGADSLSQYNDSLCFNLEFINDGYHNVCIVTGYRKLGWSDFYWSWELADKNRKLKYLGGAGICLGVGVFKQNITYDWDILKLKSTQMKLRTVYNNKEYIVEIQEK